MIGSVLDGTYRVVERLGAGAMGEVFLVEHVHLGRREAIKVLRPEVAADARLVSRFRREARAINRLRHPNIIGIYDFGQLPDGRLYLTMEHAAGATLDQLLRGDGRLTVPRALHLLHQIAGAIDHAHDHGVVHRDLKPHNLVVVEERGRPDVIKILDFGLAKIVNPGGAGAEELTLQGEVFGTAEYMAPERLAGGPDDPRSDLYAIGCVAHELLTGRPPFVGPRALVMAAHMQSEAPAMGGKVGGIPPVLDAIIGQLLAKDPADRLQTGRQLCAALEQVPGFPRKRSLPRTGMMALADPGRGEVMAGGRVEVHDEVTLQDRGRAPRPMAFADTATASTEEVLEEVLAALVDLAQQTVDLHPGDGTLAVALLAVHRVRADLTAIAAEQVALEERQAAAIQDGRAREGSLRFAAAELRYERQRTDPPPPAGVLVDLDYQIAQLDARVRDLTATLHAELAALDERGIELAAAAHDVETRWLDAHRQLHAALAARLGTAGAGAAPEPGDRAELVARFDVVGTAAADLLAAAMA